MNLTNYIKDSDEKYIAGTYARYDVCIEKGENATCTSYDGKKYIDFTSGIGVNSLGFCDKKWASAVSRQLGMLQHCSNLFYTGPCVELAELLVTRSGMERVFFANSGAEANECAIKTARKYGNTVPGRNEIITLNDSFHGRTMATITATGQDHYHKDFFPFVEGFLYADCNIHSVKSKVSDKTCAIMIEVIQGEGGVNVLDRDFVKEIEILCKGHDILLIIDEVQSGIVRTGKLFGFEHFGVKPDIVTFAKGIGAGLPLGGALFGDKCKDVLKKGDHGTTFGGNPAICSGGIEVLKRLTPEFLEDVAKKGNIIKERLFKSDKIYAFDGIGLMIGFQVRDVEAKEFVKAALDKGLLLLTAKNKVRLLPPLTVSYEELETGLGIIEKLIDEEI